MTERKYSVASIGLRIDGFLDATLQNGGIKLTYEIQDAAPANDDFETPDVMVKFSGPDVDLLLSNRAELLLALEHVTMEMLRIEELRLSAVAAADRVKRTGEHFRFNPMNSRERRVIHLSLRHETAVRSESCGAGPGRHVVVYPAGMPSLPEPPRSLEPPRRSMYDGPRPDRGPGGPPRGDRRGGGGRGDRGGRSDRGGPRGPRR